MFTPSTGPGARRRRSASRRATASAPSLLNPIRFTTARSVVSRNSRGGSFPGWGRPVTVPTSTWPNPSAPSASIPTAFLSKPAASPSTLGKVSPIVVTGEPGVRRRLSTGRAARTARKPSRCARSASSRVKPWSKRKE